MRAIVCMGVRMHTCVGWVGVGVLVSNQGWKGQHWSSLSAGAHKLVLSSQAPPTPQQGACSSWGDFEEMRCPWDLYRPEKNGS